MSISLRVKIDLASTQQMIKNLGLNAIGDVQKFVTHNINRRMTKYMPFRTGVLATKLKHVASPTTILVLGPYAKYQYYGKVMVNSVTGKGPGYIEDVGYRYRKGTILKVTERDLEYSTRKNAMAGPFWDRRLMEFEGEVIAAETQAYIARRRG